VTEGNVAPFNRDTDILVIRIPDAVDNGAGKEMLAGATLWLDIGRLVSTSADFPVYLERDRHILTITCAPAKGHIRVRVPEGARVKIKSAFRVHVSEAARSVAHIEDDRGCASHESGFGLPPIGAAAGF